MDRLIGICLVESDIHMIGGWECNTHLIIKEDRGFLFIPEIAMKILVKKFIFWVLVMVKVMVID